VEEWWGNGKTYGLALICGSVSGNLEMTEIEGRACGGDMLTEIQNQVDELEIGAVWDLLIGPGGYSEMSPSGGLHLLYRIIDHEVPGNTKIAHNEEGLVLAETRGEGGYVIAAPTPGVCHPSGEAWVLLKGEYGQLPEITWEQRCKVHLALARALDTSTHPTADYVARAVALLPSAPDTSRPPPVSPPQTQQSTSSPTTPSTTQSGSSPTTRLNAQLTTPGDHFESVTDWAEILEPHGWRVAGRNGPERFWVRPGKDPRDGHSATTGKASDRDRLYVFSTSTVFDHEVPYTKFGAYALLNFGSNHHLAANDLARRGYGTRAEVDELGVLQRPVPNSEPEYDHTDTGYATLLHHRVRGRFCYLEEEKLFLFWDGKMWRRDRGTSIRYEFKILAKEKLAEARSQGDEKLEKLWLKCQETPKINRVVESLLNEPGFVIRHEDLDLDEGRINLKNGILNLETLELEPHSAQRMMTKIAGTAFEPEATCPQFDSFVERVLPDPGMRSYVQRALGYSLLGEADRRALFLICGPSGTGKSTLMSAMESLFGDYGTSAPSGTLRATGREGSGPSNDLHMLMGRRFVSTSETNEHTAYNEDLIKRLTGRDTISSRRLYQDYVNWSPRCAIWLATNHPPRFSSDDDAIWQRAKIVPFHTVLTGQGEIPDFAHKVLRNEMAGILNWLLEGLRAYREQGLDEPGDVQDMASDVRLQSDPVARFLDDQISDGALVEGEGQQIRTSDLYMMYVDWARRTGERTFGNRRFTRHLQSHGRDLEMTKLQNNYFWTGLGKGNLIKIQIPAWSPGPD
jgi:putative DNA primase/helicase